MTTTTAGIEDQREALAKRYKLRLRNRLPQIAWALILAHIGLLIVVAVYYASFEITPAQHAWWHSVVPNGNLRHNIRDVAEGVLGGFLAKAVLWNHFKKSHQRAGRVFDKLHILEVPAALLTTAILGVAAFTGGYYILHALAIHTSSPYPTGSLWSRTSTLWNSNWDKKALGFLTAMIAARPMHAIFDDIQGYFAGRRVSLGRPPRFYAPVTFKNRYRYLLDNKQEVRHYSRATELVMPFLVLAGVGLAAWGYYILTYVA